MSALFSNSPVSSYRGKEKLGCESRNIWRTGFRYVFLKYVYTAYGVNIFLSARRYYNTQTIFCQATISLCGKLSLALLLRELDGKFAVFSLAAGDGNIFAEIVHDRFADIKAKPYSRFIESAALVALVEAVEYMRNILRRNANAFIVYLDDDLCLLLRDGKAQLTLRLRQSNPQPPPGLKFHIR